MFFKGINYITLRMVYLYVLDAVCHFIYTAQGETLLNVSLA